MFTPQTTLSHRRNIFPQESLQNPTVVVRQKMQQVSHEREKESVLCIHIVGLDLVYLLRNNFHRRTDRRCCNIFHIFPFPRRRLPSTNSAKRSSVHSITCLLIHLIILICSVLNFYMGHNIMIILARYEPGRWKSIVPFPVHLPG